MTKYQITENQLRNLINVQTITNSGCKIGFREGKPFAGKEGHENCSACLGNYYNGGACNYNTTHTFEDDLSRITQNFAIMDNLYQAHCQLKEITEQELFTERQEELYKVVGSAMEHCTNPGYFFSYTCPGIHRVPMEFRSTFTQKLDQLNKGLAKYLKQIEQITPENIKTFTAWLKKIKQLEKENEQKAEEYNRLSINLTNAPRAKQLKKEMADNEEQIRMTIDKLDTHPAFPLFDTENEEILKNTKKALVEDSPNNFWAGLGKAKGQEEIKNLKANKTKTEPEKVEDLKKMMAEVEAKNRENMKEVNKYVEQVQNESLANGKRLQDAINRNDKRAEAILLAKHDKLQEELGNALLERENVPGQKDFKEYLELLKKEEGSFWENINID
ncbi:5949_t:CDS:2 [Ambispora gerdemannii]|uniref:5949_t:CDS:1 n=1 Tax=Ambispora gerdemannii TaxID=144530 RepID=A0A9N8UXE4_9GLOM|nr:5949_t:CDS:2 [Ambispora gerdemannii]